MTFVNIDSNADSGGLTILPTHRVLHSLENYSTSEFLRNAAPYFRIEAMAEADAEAIRKKLASFATQGTAFVMVNADGRYLLQANADAVAGALKAVSERQSKLDVVQLHSLILEKLLDISAEAMREQTNIRYVRDIGDALEQVASGAANVAFLVNPATLNQLREIAFAGETMPQKSTDFYPKLLSGLAIYALD
jgi:uncharacterized protein (DUF1015 family)